MKAKEQSDHPGPKPEEIMARIRDGDTSAFEELFHLYCQSLINFAHRFVHDTQTAENIVQDIFLKIWENRRKLDPALEIKIYLYTAVKNRSLKHLRHIKIRHRSSETIGQMQILPLTPEEETQRRETAVIINEAINKLPEKARIIFSMNRFDRLTYAEIAGIQKISIKTVETHMGRALKFLRNNLSHLLSVLV